MVSILAAVLTTIVVFLVGSGIGYLIWIKTRPKKLTWKCYVYQMGDGIIPGKKDKAGNLITISLHDMKPYMTDTLERVEKDHGVEIYNLQRLNKTTPAVDANCVEYWGKDEKVVRAILVGASVTLLKSSYDNLNNQVFIPMPYERMNMIKDEIAMRKDRTKPTKDILEKISPWVVAGILVLGLVSIAYFIGGSYVEMSENFKEGADKLDNSLENVANIIRDNQPKNINTQGATTKSKPPTEIPT